ncbi:flagellar motor protein MotB [Cohnella nanjingensis]|uniref:Flagellar motor protein MotB n=1 Tax=Cohnella nanjingensis TaxID=1387779 RepID=A0A7X0VDT8_9BACL|nr:flagellar motor protein MotB [Cohnella nanjingensis]MBB6670312.1 flagellar motor protein MotB [Cohnella nanjingensis]
MSKRHRHEPHEEHPDESWLLPYSDLMTLLLALFIVLYAASSVNTSKLEEMNKAFKTAFSSGIGLLDKSAVIQNEKDDLDKRQKQERADTEQNHKSLVKQEQENLEKLKRQLDQYIKKNGLSTQLETQLNQSQLMITIRDNALFPSGTADVKPEARKLAVAIGTMLEKYPDYEVIVSGHTDNQPINTFEFASNWELSSKRAINFMKILLQNPAFDPKKFSAIGYGEYRPLEKNDTDAGRAKNRRVEVSILRKYTDAPNESTTLNAIAHDASQVGTL